jgi:hypothetical protein
MDFYRYFGSGFWNRNVFSVTSSLLTNFAQPNRDIEQNTAVD